MAKTEIFRLLIGLCFGLLQVLYQSGVFSCSLKILDVFLPYVQKIYLKFEIGAC